MNRIKELRKRDGMTQHQLGQLLNVQEAAISKYENENIPMTADTLMELSKIFNVTTDYILGNDEHEISGLGERIKNLRTSKGMTQKDLAIVLDVTPKAINFYESGERKPKYENLIALADIFGVSIDYLTGKENESIKDNVFGKRLREIRAEKAMTQQDLSEKLGIAQSTIANYESSNREPDLETVIALADLFNVSTDYLLGFDAESRKKKKRAHPDWDMVDHLEAISSCMDAMISIQTKIRNNIKGMVEILKEGE